VERGLGVRKDARAGARVPFWKARSRRVVYGSLDRPPRAADVAIRHARDRAVRPNLAAVCFLVAFVAGCITAVVEAPPPSRSDWRLRELWAGIQLQQIAISCIFGLALAALYRLGLRSCACREARRKSLSIVGLAAGGATLGVMFLLNCMGERWNWTGGWYDVSRLLLPLAFALLCGTLGCALFRSRGAAVSD